MQCSGGAVYSPLASCSRTVLAAASRSTAVITTAVVPERVVTNGHLERTRRLLPVVARLELVQIGCCAAVFGSRRTNGHSPASSGVIPGPAAIWGISVTLPSTVYVQIERCSCSVSR